jgi:3-oxoacyl-[acyl-carrier protein] reductase
MNKLQHKTALVTGGSRGMGSAIVKALAAQGANVLFTYQSADARAEAVVADVKQAGGTAIALKANSANNEQMMAAVKKAVEHFGGIDILVNNAGIAIAKPLADYTMQDYEDIMGVNLRGVFVASQEAARHMPTGGRIITIGSNMGNNAVSANMTLYTTSKAALHGLTRGMARDLGPQKITVNLVQPGPVDTDMNPDNTDLATFLKTRMPMGEYGKGEDIAAMVSFLAGEESGYITGSILTVDGGFNA